MSMQDPDEYGDEFEDEEPEVDDDATADFAAGEPESEEDELIDEFDDTPPPETNRRRRAPLRVRLSRRSASRRTRSAGDNEDDEDDEEENASESDDEQSSASQPMTARQIARANRAKGIAVEEPMDVRDSYETPQTVDTDIALRRSELARRRRNQSEKKLEDDKTETINRLLKKQAGRVRGKSRQDGEEAAPKERAKPYEGPLPYFRYVSRVGGAMLAVPLSNGGQGVNEYDRALRCAFGKSENEWA
ncbi:hypothetical protein MCUN1_000218 [Malassezia cuniculi]|uniref:INO80 complex subunit B-like conserved region domain-containing protein n=1 Tax=Malassezia cuniculi TaxID=948313 RepID=A0AAF0J4U2_9BASI|nr:hypothetical protein MCUN1_000218 [Malassezia cuniculi]